MRTEHIFSNVEILIWFEFTSDLMEKHIFKHFRIYYEIETPMLQFWLIVWLILFVFEGIKVNYKDLSINPNLEEHV